MRTEMRVALAVALVAALVVALWLAAPSMPEQRFAEQCPWYHCEEDIPLPQAAKFGQ
ncbi:MAG TPA: hypothetical protein VI358_01030 [Pseudolabrys sp.]